MLRLVRTAVPSLSVSEAREVVDALASLYSVRTGMDIPLEEFVPSIIEAIRKATPADPRFGETACIERLEAAFRKLLDVRPLSMISKAKDLQYEHENTFCDARIVTDLRPVFDTDIKSAPAGVVLTHTLKLEYHHCGKHTELYVAMDADDVANLFSVLVRAHEKAETLSALVKEWGLDKLSE